MPWERSPASPRSAAAPSESFEDALRTGIERANKTLRGVRGAWVKEQGLDIEDGRIVAYKVNLLVTFILDD